MGKRGVYDLGNEIRTFVLYTSSWYTTHRGNSFGVLPEKCQYFGPCYVSNYSGQSSNLEARFGKCMQHVPFANPLPGCMFTVCGFFTVR